MSKEKILRAHSDLIIYENENWALLQLKRKRAIELLEMFKQFNPYVYGSIARGNVHEESDIDIIFLNVVPTFQIELILYENGMENSHREILMATPIDSIKLYIYLNELESITIPITKLETRTRDFYDFGGKVNLAQLKENIRVSGIDKRLVFIKPNELGHEELSVINNEKVIAKDLGINISIIEERKKVLLRREKHGRTGVFLKREISKDETVESVLKDLMTRKSIIRNKLIKR